MQPIDLTWAGGEHSFLLRIGELRALQDRCDAGPEWILNRLQTRQWRVNDVTETIRLGLEGAGMEKSAARRLVAQHVEDQPLSVSVITATLVLASSLYDRSADTVGDQSGEAAAGEATTPSPSRGDNGGSPASTEPVSSSESVPSTSTA